MRLNLARRLTSLEMHYLLNYRVELPELGHRISRGKFEVIVDIGRFCVIQADGRELTSRVQEIQQRSQHVDIIFVIHNVSITTD